MNKRTLNHISIVSVIIGSLLLIYFIYTFNEVIANSEHVPVPLNTLPSRFIYWLGISSATLPLLFRDTDKKIKVFSVAILSACILLTYPLFSTTYGYPSGRDAIYSYQLCEDIQSRGYWDINAVTGIAKQYSHYPATHIFIVTASETTGIPLATVFAWALPILRLLLIPSLIFLIFREFFDEKTSLLCVFLYVTNPSLTNWIHHEGFAIIFFLMSLYIAIKLMKTPTPALIILNLIFGCILVLSHHFTAYVWLSWIAALFISSKIPKRFLDRYCDSEKYVFMSSNYIIFFMVAFLSWGAFVTNMDMVTHAVDIPELLKNILSPFKHITQPSSLGISFWFHEKIFLYSSIVVYGIYTLIGVTAILRIILGKTVNNEKFPLFFIVNFIFSLLLVASSSILWTTEYYFILLRIFEFAYIGIIPVTVSGIKAISNKRGIYKNLVVPLSLIILLIGGNIMNGELRYYYVDRSTISNDNPLFLTPTVYEAGIWFRDNYKGGSVLGDSLIYDALGGFGRTEVNIYNEELIYDVYGSEDINESTMHNLGVNGIRYVVTHRYMSKYPAHEISDRTYTEKQLNKFEKIPYFKKIYNNSVTIYEINPY